MNTTLNTESEMEGDFQRATDVDEDMSRPGDTDSEKKSSPFISKIGHKAVRRAESMGDSMPLRGKAGSNVNQQ